MGNVFNDAEMLLDAGSYSGSGSLLDQTGNGHDAQLGSTAGADTNDPTFLAHDGTNNYLWFPGTTSNTVTGSLPAGASAYNRFRFEVSATLDDWSPGADSQFININNTRPMLRIDSTDSLDVFYFDGSSTQRSMSPVTQPSAWFTNGERGYIRVTVYDDGADTFADWESSLDGGTWTDRGTTTRAGETLGYAGAANVDEIGAGTNGVGTLGRIHYAKYWRDGILTVNFVAADDVEPARTALDLDSVSDYISIPDADNLDTPDLDVTIDIAVADWTPAVEHWLADKYGTGVQASWRLFLSTAGVFRVDITDDGVDANRERLTTIAANTLADGSRHTLRFVVDANNGSDATVFSVYIDGSLFETVTSAATALGTIFAGTEPVLVGDRGTGNGIPNAELFGFTMKDSIDGTVVLNVDATDETPGASSFTAVTGQTVTLSGAAIVADGQLRIHDSTPTYAEFPGAAGDYADAPSIAAYQISGDIELVAKVTAVWSTSNGAIHGNYSTTAADRLYLLRTNGAGAIRLVWYETGTTQKFETSSVVVPFGDGETGWVKVTMDVDNGASDAEVKFYTSTDTATNDPNDVTWTQLGSTQTVGAVTDIQTPGSGYPYEIGRAAGGTYFTGQVHRAITKDGIDGTIVFDADLTDLAPGITSFTEDSSNAATVTINGNAAILGGSNKWDVNRASSGLTTALVDRPMFVLDGVDDYLQIPNNLFDLDVSTTSQDLTVIIAHRTHNLASGTIIAKRDSTLAADAGWIITSDGSGIPTAEISDGTNEASDTGTAIIASALVTVGLIDTTFSGADEMELFQNGVGTGSPGDTSSMSGGNNSDTLQIGAESDGGVPWDGEFYAAALWTRALTDAEMLEASQRMQNAYTATEPDLTLEIGFNAEPLDTEITWTDISDDLQQINLRRGRQFELNRFEAGTLTAVLNNQDGNYDPENTGAATPYLNNISPLKHVRVTAVDPSTPVGINNPTLFRGYTEGWEQKGHKVYTTTLTASDTFKALNLLPLGDNYYTEVLKDEPLGLWKFTETQGTTFADSSGNDLTGTEAGSIDITLNTGSPFQNNFGSNSITVTSGASETGWLVLPESGDTTLYQTTNGDYTFEALLKHDSGASARTENIYAALPTGGDNTGRGILVQLDSTGHVALSIWPGAVNFATTAITDDQWVHVVVVVTGVNARLYFDGVLIEEKSIGNDVTFGTADANQRNRLLGWDAVNDDPYQGAAAGIAVYDHALTASRVLAHYNATLNGWPEETLYDRFTNVLTHINWPTLRQNLDTNTDAAIHQVAGLELADNSALTYLADIANSLGAEFFVDANGDLCLRSRDWRAENNTTTNITVGDDPASSEIGYNDISLSKDDQYTYTHVDATGSNNRKFTVEGDDFDSTTDLQRTYTASSPHTADDNVLQAEAEWLTEVYQTPRTRIKSVTIPARATDAALTQVIYRELGDRVTIKRRPPGGYTVSFDAFIEAINHTIDRNLKRWNTTWQLSPAEPHISVALVGTALVGSGGAGDVIVGW